MKKIILVAMTGLFLLGLTSCGSTPKHKDDRSKIDKNYKEFMNKNSEQLQ